MGHRRPKAQPTGLRPDGSLPILLPHWRENVPDDRLAQLMRDTTRGLTRALQLRLAEYHVSFGHWTFLRVLWDGDGLTQRELSDQAGLMEPTTFAALRAMEQLGLVERRYKAGNRKSAYIYLTPASQALRDKLVPLAEQVNAIAVRGMTLDAVTATRSTLLAMIENLAQDEAATAEMQRQVSVRAAAGPGCETPAPVP